jgi:hypothetical protein
MAERILGAKYIELPGIDHLPWVGSPDTILDEVEDFLTGVRRGPEPDLTSSVRLNAPPNWGTADGVNSWSLTASWFGGNWPGSVAARSRQWGTGSS